MASFPLASIDCPLIAQEKRLNPSKGYSQFLGRRRTLSCSLSNHGFSAAPRPISLKYSGFRPQTRLLCSSKFRLVVNENTNTDTSSLRVGNSGLRKKFSLRLRPRFRLFSNKLRRNASIRSILDGIVTFVRKNADGIMTFLQKNAKRVTFAASVSTVLCICFLFLKITAMPTPEIVPYSDLITSLQNGNVAKVLFEEETRRIYYSTKPLNAKDGETVEEDGSLSRSETFLDSSVVTSSAAQSNVGEGNVLGRLAKSRKSSPVWEFSTRKIDHDEAYLLSLIREKGISYSSAPQSILTSMRSTLIMVLTLWIPLSPFMWILYRQFSAANSPARKRGPSNQLVCFEDVEGVDSAKVELMEIVCCLHGSINYKKLGAKLPRGVLLVGPPGTGKTLLARAVAGEAGVSFFSVSASEFVELFVGRGAARIRDLFVVARKNAPSIIFIDELDAVGGKRGRSFNDERDQTLNQLLTEMDGFESDSNIVVIAATNRPEALDPALCRPGRFSRKVFVGEPDEEGRKKILAIHFRNVPLEEDLGLICDLVASLTQGFVGADLANIANESALLAARRGAETVSREDILEAVERAKFGINEKQTRPNISKELGKLFPWMPSLINRSDARRDSTQGLLGYQTLS